MSPEDLRASLPLFEAFVGRFAELLGHDRRGDRLHAWLQGLLLDNDDHKTAEAIALKVYEDPSQVRMMQVFLGQSPWSDAPLREEMAQQVAREIGETPGVLILDETSFPKCGTKSVGVARQYCGATGKIDNCQVAVYLGYATSQEQTLIDTRLYLPETWTNDPDRCAAAGVPQDVVFRTKPELALELILRRRQTLPHGWITFDEVYGQNVALVRSLEDLQERYVGAVPKTTLGWLEKPQVQAPGRGKGRPRKKARVACGEPEPQTVEAMAGQLPAGAWQRLTYRTGSKGEQQASFARLRFYPERDDLPGPPVWLLIERSLDQQPQSKYWLSNATEACPLLEMVQAAHCRWPIEDCFLRGKEELGMDEYEVQGWRGWHHHQTLVLLAMWFLLSQQRRLEKKASPD